MLKKYKKLGKELVKAARKGASTQVLNEKYKKAQSKFKKLTKAHKQAERQRQYNKISDLFEANDHKGVWTRIQSLTGQGTRSEVPDPVKNKEERLQMNLEDILNVQKEHYQGVMQFDPENLAMNKEYWAAK